MTPTQPELFSEGPAAPVDVALDAARWTGVASELDPELRMGTSSWTFPGWEGLVWDRRPDPRALGSHGLAAYAKHPLLRCVGLDRTYYDPLDGRTFGLYREQVPDHFRFVVKADRRLVFRDGPGSNTDLLLDPAWATERVVAPAVEGLGVTLGALLFQFPPMPATAFGGPRPFAETLYRFLDALPPGPRYAVEIRTPEFLTRDYMAAVHHAGAGHSYVVHPSMPSTIAQLDAAPPARGAPAVVRWMLQPGHRYAEARDTWAPFDRMQSPDPKRRAAVAETISRILEIGASPLVVVNNKAEGSAPASIAALAEALASR
jgi:uncharacterized protein YecE (DUF72 family)